MSEIPRCGFVVALLALACVLSPGFARADADTTPPVLQALSLPAQVFVDAHGADVTVSARITDDQSGVAATRTCTGGAPHVSGIVFRSPSTSIFVTSAFAPVGGDQYAATVHLPNYAQAGTWNIETVLLADCAGNQRSIAQKGLVVAGFPTGVAVKGPSDTEPPVVRRLSPSPASVDNGSAAEVVVSATITDDLSGVADETADCGEFPAPRIQIAFSSPLGTMSAVATFRRRDVDVYDATVRLPRFAEVGTWKADGLYLIDCARNARILQGDDLHAPGLVSSFEVTGVDDRTPPVVAGLSIAPQVVDTRAAGADVGFDARVTDDLTGVSTLDGTCSGAVSYVNVTPPSGFPAFTMPLQSNGTDDYLATVSLPRFAEPGTWTVRLFVSDCALNHRELGPAELAAAGFPSSFRVLAAYDFGGFMSPLDPAVMAERNAGSAMAVKFRLGGAQGLSIFAAGFPQVQPIDCATRQPTGAAVPLNAIEWRFQDLTDGVYHYKWKSSPDWHAVCRRLVLGFDDGSRYSADVHFS